jgi:hypothetical protein
MTNMSSGVHGLKSCRVRPTLLKVEWQSPNSFQSIDACSEKSPKHMKSFGGLFGEIPQLYSKVWMAVQGNILTIIKVQADVFEKPVLKNPPTLFNVWTADIFSTFLKI